MTARRFWNAFLFLQGAVTASYGVITLAWTFSNAVGWKTGLGIGIPLFVSGVCVVWKMIDEDDLIRENRLLKKDIITLREALFMDSLFRRNKSRNDSHTTINGN